MGSTLAHCAVHFADYLQYSRTEMYITECTTKPCLNIDASWLAVNCYSSVHYVCQQEAKLAGPVVPLYEGAELI